MKHKFTFSILMVAFAMTAMMVSCEKENGGGGSPVDTTGTGGDTPADTTGTGGNPGGEVTDTNWVDLGLPSGLLWATCNIGATNPEGYGDYFAWGETQTKSVYNWSTYRYCTVDTEGALATLTKYNTSTSWGAVDNLTTLQPSDDAATANLDNGARTPTIVEWEELINNTTVTWTTLNGINGRRFTATNGKSIFLPATGHRYDSDSYGTNICGNYWASSLNTGGYSTCAWSLYFNSDDQSLGNGSDRCMGFSVRAVKN